MSKEPPDLDAAAQSNEDYSAAHSVVRQLAEKIQKIDEEDLVNYVALALEFEPDPDEVAIEIQQKLRELCCSAEIGSAKAVRHLAQLAVTISGFLDGLLQLQSNETHAGEEASADIFPKNFTLEPADHEYGWPSVNRERAMVLAARFYKAVRPLYKQNEDNLKKICRDLRMPSPSTFLFADCILYPPKKKKDGSERVSKSNIQKHPLVEELLCRLIEIRLRTRSPIIVRRTLEQAISWPTAIKYSDTLNTATVELFKRRIGSLGLGVSNPVSASYRYLSDEIQKTSDFAAWVFDQIFQAWLSVASARNEGGGYWEDIKLALERELKVQGSHVCQHALRLERVWWIAACLLPAPTKATTKAWAKVGMLMLQWRQWLAHHPLPNGGWTQASCLADEAWDWIGPAIDDLPILQKDELFDSKDTLFACPSS